MARPYNGGKPTFNEGISPIGLFVHMFHDKPQLKTSDQYGKVPDIDPDTQVQRAEFKVTLAWEKTRQAELGEMANLARRTQEEGWPGSTAPNARFALQPFFRDGDNPEHNTNDKDYLFGKYYLNFKQKALIVARDTSQPVGPQNYRYDGGPGFLGPMGGDDIIMPGDLWPGCRGRVSFIMFATEYMGKHFISTRMQNLQKLDEGDGTRIGGGGRPTPQSQFGALIDAPAGGNAGGMFGLGNAPAGAGGGMFPGTTGNAGIAGQNGSGGNTQQGSANPFGQIKF